jgi:hypothetical protein
MFFRALDFLTFRTSSRKVVRRLCIFTRSELKLNTVSSFFVYIDSSKYLAYIFSLINKLSMPIAINY